MSKTSDLLMNLLSDRHIFGGVSDTPHDFFGEDSKPAQTCTTKQVTQLWCIDRFCYHGSRTVIVVVLSCLAEPDS